MMQGKLTQGHGRVLITLEDEQEQRKYVKRVLNEGVSVRELEKARKTERQHKPSPFSHVEEMLREALKTKVQVTFRKNKGKVIIEFYSRDDLGRITEVLAGSAPRFPVKFHCSNSPFHVMKNAHRSLLRAS